MEQTTRARSLIDEITRERARGVMQRRVVGLVIVGFFGLFGLGLYNKVNSFDDELLMRHLETQAAEVVWPIMTLEIDRVAEEAVPVISEAFMNELGAVVPKASEKLVIESRVFEEAVNASIKQSLDAHFTKALAEVKPKLGSQLPQFSDRQEMYDDLAKRLQLAAQQWAQGELDTTFKRHVHVLQSINESVLTLQAEAVKRPEPDPGDVMLIFLEILNTQLIGKES